jgi:hypothetical protein
VLGRISGSVSQPNEASLDRLKLVFDGTHVPARVFLKPETELVV